MTHQGTGEFAPLSLGPHRVWPPVVLAPMAGVTNSPFRRLCRRFGAGLYVSEMLTARALVEGDRKTAKIARFAPDESPRSLQLYGVDPRVIGEATRRLVDEGRVDHVDLNFGCPVRKVTRLGGGAALPVRRRLLGAIVGATVAAAGEVPVTVKFRVGVDDAHPTFLDTGKIAAEEGAAAIALHARTAAQLYAGEADWNRIAELKAHVSSIPVLGNGDIWEPRDALAMMRSTGCDGVVVGRGCLGRPWLFGDLAAAFSGREAPPPRRIGEVVPVMAEHAASLVDWFGARGIRDFRKHTGWYLKGYPVGGEIRSRLSKVDSLPELDDLCAELDPSAELGPDGLRAKRGHTGGPQEVALPEGWLDHPDDLSPLPPDADSPTSGG